MAMSRSQSRSDEAAHPNGATRCPAPMKVLSVDALRARHPTSGHRREAHVTLSASSDLAPGDIVLLGQDRWEHVPSKAWTEETSISVVRAVLDDQLLIEGGLGAALRLVPRRGVDVAVSNTIEYAEGRGVLQMSTKPIHTHDRDSEDEPLDRFRVSPSEDGPSFCWSRKRVRSRRFGTHRRLRQRIQGRQGNLLPGNRRWRPSEAGGREGGRSGFRGGRHRWAGDPFRGPLHRLGAMPRRRLLVPVDQLAAQAAEHGGALTALPHKAHEVIGAEEDPTAARRAMGGEHDGDLHGSVLSA